MENNKLNDSLLKKLYSENIADTNEALDTLAHSGNSEYIPSIIDIYSKNSENETGAKAYKILSEIKHTDAVPILIKNLEDPKYKSIQEPLIRICWENGLDFTNYLSTFVKLLINGDYMTSFEAYTLIENTEGKLSHTSLHELLDQLKAALDSASDERQTLIHHIIQFLPSLVQE